MKKATRPEEQSRQKAPRDFTTTGDPVRAFVAAIAQDTGATVDPIADGKFHRFDCPEGKRGNRACWYVLHPDGWGAYGNWRTGIAYPWRADRSRDHDREQGARIAAAIDAARRQREREQAQAQENAARRAQRLWSDAKPATTDHPYLTRKRIPALCLRQHGDCLLVPLRTVAGELVNVQRIHPDGTKRFLKGGRITGTFALFGRELPEEGELYIAEGWATAATIATTLRRPVVAAMNAGNLAAAAQAIRAARPGLALTLAADDDHGTPGNPGITKAAEAARLVQGAMTWPTTCRQEGCTCTDFNDTANCGRAPQ
ncbi:toprim domain-containing protein [Haliea atlantica]